MATRTRFGCRPWSRAARQCVGGRGGCGDGDEPQAPIIHGVLRGFWRSGDDARLVGSDDSVLRRPAVAAVDRLDSLSPNTTADPERIWGRGGERGIVHQVAVVGDGGPRVWIALAHRLREATPARPRLRQGLQDRSAGDSGTGVRGVSRARISASAELGKR